jgi:hypothetical protein
MTDSPGAVITNYWTSVSFPPGATGAPVGPYLIPPSLPTTYTAPLDIWVAALCAPDTTATTPGIPTSTNQPAFSLTFEKSQVANDPSMFAKVSVVATFVYSADPTIRAQMKASFVAFRALLESLEVPSDSTTGGLIPGGAALVANRIATNMPLRFDETLGYLYSFDPSLQYVDLVPGMTLRAEWSGYQYCDGPNGAGYSRNSFVGSGTGRYPVTRRSDGTLALDAFLGQFTPGYALSPAATCPLYAAGLIDLQLAANARRHLRLFFPNTVSGAGSLDNAGALTQSGSRLIGADTYADLEAATADVLAGRTGCGTGSVNNQPVVSIVFNGRVTAIPEIDIVFSGAPATVPVGTTLRNVLERIADPAPGQLYQSSYSNLYVRMSRWTQLAGPPVKLTANPYMHPTVTFDTSPPALAPLGDCFDIPLAKGDVVQLPNMNVDMEASRA